MCLPGTSVGHRSSSIVRYKRGDRSRSIAPPQSQQRQRRYRYRICTCTPRRARKDPAAKRPERFDLSRTRAAARQKDHALRALAVDAVWPTRSPLSRFGAAERRSREHSSEHTKVCRHADEQATLLPAAKLLQPPSAAEHKPNCRLGTGEWMSASAEVSGRARDQRDGR